jgi:hypothetical protein
VGNSLLRGVINRMLKIFGNELGFIEVLLFGELRKEHGALQKRLRLMAKDILPFLYEIIVHFFGMVAVHKSVGIPEAIAFGSLDGGVVNIIS